MIFQANLRRQFAWNVTFYFLRKIRKIFQNDISWNVLSNMHSINQVKTCLTHEQTILHIRVSWSEPSLTAFSLECVEYRMELTTKALIKTAVANILIFFFFFFFFSGKMRLNISCKSSAWQIIQTKCQVLFSLKNKRKKWTASVINFALCFKVNEWWSNHVK